MSNGQDQPQGTAAQPPATLPANAFAQSPSQPAAPDPPQTLPANFFTQQQQAATPSPGPITRTIGGAVQNIMDKALAARIPGTEEFRSQNAWDVATGMRLPWEPAIGEAGQRHSHLGGAPAQLKQGILDAANEFNIEPKLLTAIMAKESSFNPQAVGQGGERGLMQFTPGTWKAMTRTQDNPQGLPFDQAFDAKTNVRMGAKLLRQLLNQHGGNMREAIFHYNANHNIQAGNAYAQAVMNIYGHLAGADDQINHGETDPLEAQATAESGLAQVMQQMGSPEWQPGGQPQREETPGFQRYTEENRARYMREQETQQQAAGKYREPPKRPVPGSEEERRALGFPLPLWGPEWLRNMQRHSQEIQAGRELSLGQQIGRDLEEKFPTLKNPYVQAAGKYGIPALQILGALITRGEGGAPAAGEEFGGFSSPESQAAFDQFETHYNQARDTGLSEDDAMVAASNAMSEGQINPRDLPPEARPAAAPATPAAQAAPATPGGRQPIVIPETPSGEEVPLVVRKARARVAAGQARATAEPVISGRGEERAPTGQEEEITPEEAIRRAGGEESPLAETIKQGRARDAQREAEVEQRRKDYETMQPEKAAAPAAPAAAEKPPAEEVRDYSPMVRVGNVLRSEFSPEEWGKMSAGDQAQAWRDARTQGLDRAPKSKGGGGAAPTAEETFRHGEDRPSGHPDRSPWVKDPNWRPQYTPEQWRKLTPAQKQGAWTRSAAKPAEQPKVGGMSAEAASRYTPEQQGKMSEYAQAVEAGKVPKFNAKETEQFWNDFKAKNLDPNMGVDEFIKVQQEWRAAHPREGAPAPTGPRVEELSHQLNKLMGASEAETKAATGVEARNQEIKKAMKAKETAPAKAGPIKMRRR